tara:strand:+ start:402 stop:536 length:135 start_codon:yes stop_codon:yes gene_type:complete
MKKVEQNRIKAYWRNVLRQKGKIPQEMVDKFNEAVANWKKEIAV